MNDPYAQTVKAEFTRKRKLHRQVILDRALDDVAQATGKNRADLYVQSVTSNEAWKEDAGLSLSEDLDVTFRERCLSEKMEMDVVIDQKIGQEAVERELYKEFHGGKSRPERKRQRPSRRIWTLPTWRRSNIQTAILSYRIPRHLWTWDL